MCFHLANGVLILALALAGTTIPVKAELEKRLNL
jgi:hypothetical protein